MTKSLCVIVTCMGRLEHLRRTLPTVLEHVDARYCLVDFSCPDRAGAWVAGEYRDLCDFGRISVVSVPHRTEFHKPLALNSGARAAIAAGAEYLCFLDADTLAGPLGSSTTRERSTSTGQGCASFRWPRVRIPPSPAT